MPKNSTDIGKGAYYIHSFKVEDLWDSRTISLNLHKDVNILVGPNASGKTTLLNLLCATLTADLNLLAKIKFKQVSVGLRSFHGQYKKTISVEPSDSGLNFKISNQNFDISSEFPPHWYERKPLYEREFKRHIARLRMQDDFRLLSNNLKQLINVAWLPVSRYLPIPEEVADEEQRITRSSSRLESVDKCLLELLRQLKLYRLGLDSQLTERYKGFEDKVLEMLIPSEEDISHDRNFEDMFKTITKFDKKDKDDLKSTLRYANLLGDDIRDRIDKYFLALEQVATRLQEKLVKGKQKEQAFSVSLNDVAVLIHAKPIRSLVESARELEQDRAKIFKPLQQYEAIVNSFLEPTVVTLKVEEDGTLSIKTTFTGQTILPQQLSSGQKQIIIQLTQALLSEDHPVIYVSDEPELSLHVEWQVKLLESLKELGHEIQIIVATHSPDIIGPFGDKVIELDKLAE